MSSELSTSEESTKFFKNFFSQYGNSHCFDCGSAAGEWVSVNNGISLCDKCAETHRTFGNHISYIKSAQATDWHPSELFLLQHGGNARLREFFSSYTFEPNAAPVFKYKTLASFYYRRRMRFISEGKEVPEMPHRDRHLEQHENEGFWDTVLGGLAKFGDKVGGLFEPAEKPGHFHHHESDHPNHLPVHEDFSTLVHKGVESFKDGVSNLIGIVRQGTFGSNDGEQHDSKETELKEIKSKECDTCEGLPKDAGLLEKAGYLASKGFNAVKGGLHSAGQFLTGHSGEAEKKEEENQNLLHPETDAKIAAAQKQIRKEISIEKLETSHQKIPEISHLIKHAEQQEHNEEILEQHKEVAEKKAKEEEQLQEIANWASESVKAQTMPKSTKSKADQIRDQAAMIEAARGQTRISKGKGVSKQTVLHGKADLDYIEKLQDLAEEGGNKSSEIQEPSLTEKQVTLSTLAHEAKAETKRIDTSRAFKKSNDETFPKGKPAARMEKHDRLGEERKESERLKEKLAH